MTNVIPFQRKSPMQTAPVAESDDMPDAIEPRAAFSFDMVQADQNGFVLIDACVPMELAVEFMSLIARHQEHAVA